MSEIEQEQLSVVDTEPIDADVEKPRTNAEVVAAVEEITRPLEPGERIEADVQETFEPVPDEKMETVRPDWPLRIAVIGAPGSGKAAFAEAFAALADPWFEEQDGSLALVQNGGTAIQDGSDQAVGFFGDYREDLMAFFLPLAAEMVATKNGRSILVNGTVLGNLAHAVAGFEVIQMGLDTSGIVTPNTQVRLQQSQTSITALTFLMENFRYQFVFRLPLPPIVEVPGQDVGLERRHAARVDAALDNLCATFFLSPQVLEGTAEERAATALETIQKIVTDGVQIPKSALQRA